MFEVVIYIVAVLIFLFLLFRYLKRRYFTKVLSTFIDNFELSYIKSLKEQLERTVKYSYPKLNKNTDFKEIYNQHFNEILRNSHEYIDNYDLYFKQDEKEYQLHKRTVYSITKLMKDFDKEELSYLTRLVKLLKYNGEHYFDDCQDIKLFSGKEIKEINDFMEFFFYTEILKNDFKSIGELRKIILEMQIKYNAKGEDGFFCSGKGHIHIDVLSNLFSRLDLLHRELNWSIDNTIKKLL